MKFEDEIQFVDIKYVESELSTYNNSLEPSENGLKFATLADIKKAKKLSKILLISSIKI